MGVLEALARRAQGGSSLQRAVLCILFWPLLLALTYQPPLGGRKHRMLGPVLGGEREYAGLRRFS